MPRPGQQIEYLIDSIACADSTLQADIGLVRANTNNMREDFEATSSSLIEVDPYRRTSRGAGLNCYVSSIDFKAGHRKMELIYDGILTKILLRSLRSKMMSSGIG